MFSAIVLLLFGFATGMYLTNAKFRHVINVPLLKFLYSICWSIEQVEDRWGEIQPLPRKTKVEVVKTPETHQTTPSGEFKSQDEPVFESSKTEKTPHVDNEQELKNFLDKHPQVQVWSK